MTDVVQEGTASKLKGLEAIPRPEKQVPRNIIILKVTVMHGLPDLLLAEDPDVCVTIIVEGAGSGGDYAVPIARRIFDAYFSEKQ